MKTSLNLLITILLLASGQMQAQRAEEKRVFTKILEVTKGSKLTISNKYGSIAVTPSSSDSLTIKAEIKAAAQNSEKTRNLIEGISVEISRDGNLIKATTEFDENVRTVIEGFKEITSRLVSYESKLEINYAISAPAYLDLEIENSLGDVSVEECSGRFDLVLFKGNFRGGSLENIGEIKLSMSKASIKKIDKGNFDLSFSTVEITDSKRFISTSISSEINLGNSVIADLKSKSDKIGIRMADSVSGNAYFTELRIGNITGELNFEQRFGRIDVDLVKKSSELISVRSSNADVRLDFEPSMSYNFEVISANSFVVLPDNVSGVRKESADNGKNEYVTTGHVGSKNAKTRVQIDATRGNIYLR